MNIQTKCPAYCLVNDDNFNCNVNVIAAKGRPPLNLRSHVGTDLEPCLEKLRHTWRVFNKRLGVWLSSVLGSSTWDKVGSFKLWWRLRSCHCNCDVCWGLKWSLAQPWLIFNWHSSPHCLPLHLTTESSDLGQIYNCSQRYIYDLIMFYTILNNYCSPRLLQRSNLYKLAPKCCMWWIVL